MTIIGIDLGTSNSLVSCWTEEGVKLIPNVLGDYLTPSVVSLDENNQVLVGKTAKERLVSHPEKTAAAFKRFMGTEKKYKLGNTYFSPVELSSFILSSLKKDAETFFNETITEAVITVPAYFNNLQREATIQAAQLSRLNVVGLISEPTAAALAYGIHDLNQDISFAMIDLGGGTFDVSIMEMFEGVMQVNAISGDNFLGGENFTQEIIEFVLKEKELNIEDFSADEKGILTKAVETYKKELNPQIGGEISFRCGEARYSVSIDSKQLTEICEPLFLRMRNIILKALKDSNLSVHDLDKVILIGGATKLSIVQDYLRHLLLKFPYTEINPDEAVGIGASIQAALISRNEDVSEMMMTDVCGFSLGVEVVAKFQNSYREGLFSPMVERNSTIPISIERLFTPVSEEQDEIHFQIYQGENRFVKDNLKIGDLKILLPRKGKDQAILVRFTYDTNGVLEVIAKISETGEEKRLYIQQGSQLSTEELKKSFARLSKLKIHPREREENKYLIAKANRIYAESLGEKRDFIQKVTNEFEIVLEKQNDHDIKHAAKNFADLLNDLEKEVF